MFSFNLYQIPVSLYLLNLTRYVTRAGQSIIPPRRLISHHLCTNKELHVNSVNSKTSRSINGARGSDVGSNIELFVVGQHQLSCRPSCFKLRGSRTTMEKWSTSRNLETILSIVVTQPFEIIVSNMYIALYQTLFSRFLLCMISAILKRFFLSSTANLNSHSFILTSSLKKLFLLSLYFMFSLIMKFIYRRISTNLAVWITSLEGCNSLSLSPASPADAIANPAKPRLKSKIIMMCHMRAWLPTAP